jgi:hypothetical protein
MTTLQKAQMLIIGKQNTIFSLLYFSKLAINQSIEQYVKELKQELEGKSKK